MLGACGSSARPYWAVVSKLVGDMDEEVAGKAVKALYDVDGGKQTVARLKEAWNEDRRDGVRSAILWYVAKYHEHRDVFEPLVLESLGCETIRYHGLTALLSWPDTPLRAFLRLKDALPQADAFDAQLICRAIGRLGAEGRDAAPAIEAFLKDTGRHGDLEKHELEEIREIVKKLKAD